MTGIPNPSITVMTHAARRVAQKHRRITSASYLILETIQPVNPGTSEMPANIKASIVENIIKPQSDDRSHRGLVLDNGLKVL